MPLQNNPAPDRKSPRLKEYDYSAPGAYFVTVCTHGKAHILGEIHDGKMYLSSMGEIAENEIKNTGLHYNNVSADKYVVMPNHIHMILKLDETGKNPDINQVIAQYKSGVSRRIHQESYDIQVWQRSFHDHIIRNQKSYERIWNYIDGNPLCWEKDCFFVDQSVLRNGNDV